MEIARNVALFMTAIVAGLAFLLSHRLDDRRDRHLKSLIDQAESPDLPPRTRTILLARANRMIGWNAARIKYRSRTSLVPNLVFVAVLLTFFVVVLSPIFISGDAPAWLAILVYIGLLIPAAMMMRKIPVMEADFTRQKLCQLSAGADIEEIRPRYSFIQLLRGGMKFRSNRDEPLRYSLMAIILRDAWILQTRDTRLGNEEIGDLIKSTPSLDATREWEDLASDILPKYVNRAIRDAASRQ